MKIIRRIIRKRWEEWCNRKGGGIDNWYFYNMWIDVNNVIYKVVEFFKGELMVCFLLIIFFVRLGL